MLEPSRWQMREGFPSGLEGKKEKEEEEELEVLRSDKCKVTNCQVATSWLSLLACFASLQK